MLEKYKSVFFVGIKGVAMANLARIFQQMGKKVTGSDVDESFITDEELRSSNIDIIYSFEADKLPKNTDIVIYSAAHGGTKNEQVIEAIKRGITVMHQAEVVGELISQFQVSIAVAGCHGKTTTSSLLAYALNNLEQKPSYLVGVSTFNNMYGGEFSGKKYFVVEADEYALNPPTDKTPKFHLFHPTNAIITNIGFDHPDAFKDIEETKKAFEKFVKNLPQDNFRLIVCADDKNTLDVLSNFPSTSFISYGQSSLSDVQVTDIKTTESGTFFKIKINRKINSQLINETFNTSLFGVKNVLNATSVIVFLLQQRFSAEQIKKSVLGFTGAKRRFELKSKVGETFLFDDYAHHPEEIEATIAAARMRFPGKKIKIIFQPHTYSRTFALQEQFVTSLSKADKVYLLPVFGSAREKKSEDSVESEHLVTLAIKQGVQTIQSFPSQEALLQNIKIQLGDVIFTMGAGDVYKLEDKIVELMSKSLY